MKDWALTGSPHRVTQACRKDTELTVAVPAPSQSSVHVGIIASQLGDEPTTCTSRGRKKANAATGTELDRSLCTFQQGKMVADTATFLLEV